MEAKVLKIAGKGTGKDILTELPKPESLNHLGEKKCYQTMGQLLIKAERLKAYHLPLLESFAVFNFQWQIACKEITRLNKLKPLGGFIQRFPSGARQISPEITLRDNAFDGMLKCSKQFGLDPKSEKDLKAAEDTGQLDLFQQLVNSKKAQ